MKEKSGRSRKGTARMKVSDFPALPLLLVDDEPAALESCETVLHSGGIRCTMCCQDSREVMPLLVDKAIGVMLLDLTMPGISGQEILAMVVEQHPEIPVIIVTAADELQTAVDCMKTGAFDYLVKPFEENRLIAAVRRAMEIRSLRQENIALKERVLYERLDHPEAFSHMVTNNSAMFAVFRYVEAVAGIPQPVLISGEPGVGKTLLAKAAHSLSGRAGAFVTVDAACVDDAAFSEMPVGRARAASDSEGGKSAGLLSQAAGGTALLERIDRLSESSQLKLVRLLQDQNGFSPGSDVPVRTGVRFVATSGADLRALQQLGAFRADLYHRLHAYEVHIPPLRERLNDLPALVDHFLEKASQAFDKKKPTPPDELLTLLSTYRFPGNVRELEEMVFEAVKSHRSRKLSMAVFRAHIMARRRAAEPCTEGATAARSPFASLDALPTLRDAARLLTTEAMRRANNNQTLAAQLLGISQPALSRRLKRTRG